MNYSLFHNWEKTYMFYALWTKLVLATCMYQLIGLFGTFQPRLVLHTHNSHSLAVVNSDIYCELYVSMYVVIFNFVVWFVNNWKKSIEKFYVTIHLRSLCSQLIVSLQHYFALRKYVNFGVGSTELLFQNQNNFCIIVARVLNHRSRYGLI